MANTISYLLIIYGNPLKIKSLEIIKVFPISNGVYPVRSLLSTGGGHSDNSFKIKEGRAKFAALPSFISMSKQTYSTTEKPSA